MAIALTDEQEIKMLYHRELEFAMRGHHGKKLETKKIKEIFQNYYPNINQDWAQPSDHSINHRCSKCCTCAETENAIFKKLKRGFYEVRITK